MKKITLVVTTLLLVLLSSAQVWAASAVLVRPATSANAHIIAISPEILRQVDALITTKYGFRPKDLWQTNNTGFLRLYEADTGFGLNNCVVLSWDGSIILNKKNIGRWDNF